jgi:hypothetical protein
MYGDRPVNGLFRAVLAFVTEKVALDCRDKSVEAYING